MCGRFTLTRAGEVPAFFELDEHPELEVRYNIAPSQDVLVIPGPAGKPAAARLMKWGLRPRLEISQGSSLINARAETIDRKASFREAFRSRRCVIPADGFYEWRRDRGRKQPFHFRLRDRELFAFAGLWDRGVGRDGDVLETCTIVTTEPNGLVAEIHDRMPAMLDRTALGLWLDAEAPPDRLKGLLGPFPAHRMERVAVNPAVNRTDFDGPDCLKPPPPLLRNLELF